jgi:chemotaxis signal transduction protein
MSDPTLTDIEASSLVAQLLGESPLPGTLEPLDALPLAGLDDLVARLDRLSSSDTDLIPKARPRRTTSEKVVVFELGETLLAVPLLAVLEVVALPPVTPLPQSPDWLWGVVNLRGEIVPAIDLTSVWKLGLSPEPRLARLIVIRSTDAATHLGLIVKRVVGLRPLTGFTPVAEESTATGLHACLSGFTDQAGLPVAVCDVDRLIAATHLTPTSEH